MVNYGVVAKLVISINKGGKAGQEAVDIAIAQYEELHKLLGESDIDVDMKLIYDFLFSMNEGHANTFEANPMWAVEQAKALQQKMNEDIC